MGATFPKLGKTEVCILGTPYHEPEAAPALPRERVTGARSRSGCQVLVDLNTSLIVSNHATSAMPSPDSFMSHERIFPGRRRHFIWMVVYATPHFQNQERQKLTALLVARG